MVPGEEKSHNASKRRGFKDITNHILQCLVSFIYNIQSSSSFCGQGNVTDRFIGYYFPSFSRVLLEHLFLKASFWGFRLEGKDERGTRDSLSGPQCTP